MSVLPHGLVRSQVTHKTEDTNIPRPKPLFHHPGHNPRKTKVARRSPPVTDHDVRCARDLALLLVRHQWVTRSPRVTLWAQSFRALRTIAGISDTEVRKVLDWYVHHLADRFTPKVQSAEAFRDKFPKIREAMLRKQQDDPEVEATPAAIGLHLALASLKWPGKVHKQMLPFVQLSLDRYDKFCDLLRRKTCLEDRRVARAAEVVSRNLSSRLTFVRKWWEDHFSLVKKYPNTRLSTVAFAVDHKDFTVMGRRWVQDYCGRPDLWDQIVKEIS